MHNWPQLGLIQVKRQMSAWRQHLKHHKKEIACERFLPQSAPMAGIARQAGLMDRMALRAGIGPSSTAQAAIRPSGTRRASNALAAQ